MTQMTRVRHYKLLISDRAGSSDMDAIDFQTFITSLLLFVATGLLGWLVKLVKDYRKEWNVRAQDVEAMRRALLGAEGDEWTKRETGLIEKVENLSKTVGHNGGSTLFDGQDDLRRGQAALLRWSVNHTLEHSEVDPAHSWTPPREAK